MSEHELPERPAGTAIVQSDAIENPGFPPERLRLGDKDPARAKRIERWIVTLFWVAVVGSVGAVAAYVALPLVPGDLGSVRISNMLFGLAGALALLAIGVGLVHWAKALMGGHEIVEERHETRGTDDTRAAAVEIFKTANEESGFTRRKLLTGSLITGAVVSAAPAVVVLRGLAPEADPLPLLANTMWDKGVRLTIDPSGRPIKASDVTLGSSFHVIPEGLHESEHPLEEKAKAVVLLMRLKPEQLSGYSERGKSWSYDGIVAYSKICTHVGCPVALYEQQTHHLLCPCHQSQFDITREAAVIFGPAKRPLPQLPITVNDEGYLVAQSDFTEPVGPSYWERAL